MDRKSVLLGNDYNEILLNAIPMLSTFPSYTGGEGTAYFLNDQFVVKQFKTNQNWEYFDDIFELYCAEQRRFNQMGYSVPKIYSYLKLPNFKYYSGECPNKNNYYILEERMKGRHLYFGEIDKIYGLVADVFSRQEFKEIVTNPDDNLAEFKEIVKIFIRDYIQMNEMIESMPEDELGKFVFDIHQMYMGGEYSTPDIFPSNILLDGNHLNIIDNQIVSGRKRTESPSRRESVFVGDLLNMFYYNSEIYDLSQGCLFYLKDKKLLDVSYLRRKNIKVSKAAVIKTINVMNKYCDNPTIREARMALLAFSTLKQMFNDNDSLEIMKDIHCTQFGE